MLYLSNVLHKKYKNETLTSEIIINVYRFCITLGTFIGCLTYLINNYNNIELQLFILSIISILISSFGFLGLKCIGWKYTEKECESWILNSKNIQLQNKIIYQMQYIQ